MIKRYRASIIYAGFSLLTLVFGLIYTANGHGVTSYYMSYAFLPTAVAAVFYLALAVTQAKRPMGLAAEFFAFFVTSATVYSIVQGIFEIAGAYSNYDVTIFLIMLITGLTFFALYALQLLKPKQGEHEDENG